MATYNYHWVTAPIGLFFGEGKRWKLMRGRYTVGRVVQLIEGASWEAHATHAWYSSGHRTLNSAALALITHLRSREKPPRTCINAMKTTIAGDLLPCARLPCT